MTVSLSLELRRALRRILRAPGFSLSVIMLIAFGIGGVAAVATAGWSLFARPLPYSQSDQLVTISTFLKSSKSYSGLSEAAVEELNREQRFGELAIVDGTFDLRLKEGARVRAAQIDHRLLGVLRIAPRAGRVFARADTAPGADPVALISERFRVHYFGGDADVVGRSLELKDGRVRIVGVLPQTLAMPETRTDVWLPMELGPDKLSTERFSYMFSNSVVARMPAGMALETYRQRLSARLANDERMSSRERANDYGFVARPLREIWSAGQIEGLLILVAATVVVLLSAWFSLTGLWLARWTGRSRELAIQFALGARPGLSSIGVMLEYAMLGIPGLVFAVGVSWLGVETLYGLGVLDDIGPLRGGIVLPTVVTGLALLALGLMPVLATIRWNTRRLRGCAAGNLGGKGTGAKGDRAGVRKILTVGQIAFAFGLLSVLMMLFTSWFKLLNEDVGIDSERLVMAMIVAPGGGFSTPGPDAGVAAAVDRLRSLPGVEDISWSNVVPFGRMDFVAGYAIDERPDEHVPARPRSVGPGFFRVAGIDILSGRTFGHEDAGEQARTVIVDELFERMYLNGSAPGRRIGYPEAELTVVGVVDSVRHNTPDEQPDTPTVYTYSGAPESRTQLLLRTTLDPDSLVGAVRDVLGEELDAERVTWVTGLDSMIRYSVSDREPQLILLSAFAGLAMALVFLGLYALQSYQVASSTADLGLRRAMGASEGRIVGAELLRAIRLLPPGLLLGFAGAWLGTNLIVEELYNVQLLDPEIWAVTGAAIAITVVLASLAPALRASRVEPLEALRYE